MMSLNIGTSDICSFTRHALKAGGTRIKQEQEVMTPCPPFPLFPHPHPTPESITIKETIQWKAGNQTEVTPLSGKMKRYQLFMAFFYSEITKYLFWDFSQLLFIITQAWPQSPKCVSSTNHHRVPNALCSLDCWLYLQQKTQNQNINVPYWM